jgi:hypothetical protein
MSSVPEPIFLLLLGFGMIALSVRFRGRTGRKPVARSAEVPMANAEPLGKTVTA